MPLIFAIDSDKRQSAQLASLLRSHVEADLVQSASAIEGLEILQGRVPDLILTSSLLSPRDEATLDSHLRELGVAATHVQTLTIPVIAGTATASSKKKKPAGMLAALRREKKPAAKPSGCDPDVFAGEVQLYLERAMEQREALRAVLPPDVPAPIVDAETADSLIAAVTSVEPAIEPPTIVMLAPTVVAVVVKQPPEANGSVMPVEAVRPAPEPEAEPEPLPSALVDATPIILAEAVVESAPALSIFSVLRDPDPEEPESAPLPDLRPIADLLLGTPPAVAPVIESDPFEQLLAVPVATVEAAEQLLVAAAPEPVSAFEPVLVSESEPGLWSEPEPERTPELELAPEPVTADPPALQLVPAWVEPEAPAMHAEPAVLEDDAEPVVDRSWSFDVPREESSQLDQLLELVGGDEPAVDVPADAILRAAAIDDTPNLPIEEPELATPAATAAPPSGMAPAEFAELLAPPPTRIADAIRMPEEPVPTVDMLECHDLDALADHFAAAGLTAGPADRPRVVEQDLEPVFEPHVEPGVELSAEPWMEPTAELVGELPVEPWVEPPVEAVVEITAAPEIVEDAPVVEAVVAAEAFEEAPIVETETVAESVEYVLVADDAAFEEIVVDVPVVEAAVVAETVGDAPTVEAVTIAETVEYVLVADDAAFEEIVVDVPVVEAAVTAETVADTPIVEAPSVEAQAVDDTPAVQSAAVGQTPSTPALAWSWLEDEALPLADLLSEKPDNVAAPVEPVVPVVATPDLEPPALETPSVETPTVIVAVEPIVLVEEIYDPIVTASWNLAATAPALENREPSAESSAEAAPAALPTIQPPPAEPPAAVAESATWDPISTAAWETAVVPAPVAAPPAPAPVAVAAVPQEPESIPAVEPVPDVDVPLLDAELLAMLGMAAHRAGLDALETLDAPLAAERTTPSESRGRKRPRPDRSTQNRPHRRDARASRNVPRKERPPQDEWGIFDPAQCGPDALFDDEEWTEDDDRPSRSRATTY